MPPIPELGTEDMAGETHLIPVVPKCTASGGGTPWEQYACTAICGSGSAMLCAYAAPTEITGKVIAAGICAAVGTALCTPICKEVFPNEKVIITCEPLPNP
jgi:hypothetical protein